MIACGDNSQSAYVWDAETLDAQGKPKRLSIPAVDAREWNTRHPQRYTLVESVVFWDLQPDGGGKPRRMVAPRDAGERLLADSPSRYVPFKPAA